MIKTYYARNTKIHYQLLTLNKQHKGFTLLELLIAMAISSLLMLGFSVVYISVKNNYRLQQGLSTVAESGRFATYLLNQRIRLAGFKDCNELSDDGVDQSQAIHGYDSENVPSWLHGQVVAGSDVVVIGSCVNNTSFTQDNQFKLTAYYLGNTGRKNSQGKKILALYQKSKNEYRQELVAGLSQLKFTYGIGDESSGNIVAYQSVKQMSNWRKVKSVALEFLIDSVEPVLKRPQAYTFNGHSIMPQDLLLYKPWSTYITLRERYAVSP